MTGPLIAGIGMRRGCPAEAIIAVFERACDELGRRATALAAPAFKADEPGLQHAATQLALPLILVDPGALAATQARCLTRSDRARDATGFASIAEGCALAAVDDGRLVLPRIALAGATCALAEPVTA